MIVSVARGGFTFWWSLKIELTLFIRCLKEKMGAKYLTLSATGVVLGKYIDYA